MENLARGRQEFALDEMFRKGPLGKVVPSMHIVGNRPRHGHKLRCRGDQKEEPFGQYHSGELTQRSPSLTPQEPRGIVEIEQPIQAESGYDPTLSVQG